MLAVHAFWQQSRKIAYSALASLYPASCPCCHRALADDIALCAQCWSSLSLIERPFCERLGTPMPVDHGTGLLSPAAMADPPVYDRARAAVRYDASARLLVHRLKYGDRPELSKLLAQMMWRAGHEILAGADLLVPVPLHRTRLWWRRFNQAALLAEAVSVLSGVKHDPLMLTRIKRTQTQVGLTRAKRRENLQGAFAVPVERQPFLSGKRVVLIDDVFTTGSTANATARILLRNGAAHVDCLAFARVVMEENAIVIPGKN
jgi:ComF family protein